MTNEQVVERLRKLQRKLAGDADVSRRAGSGVTTVNAYYRASVLVRTLADEIEAESAGVEVDAVYDRLEEEGFPGKPPVTPAKAAATYQQVEEQGADPVLLWRRRLRAQLCHIQDSIDKLGAGEGLA